MIVIEKIFCKITHFIVSGGTWKLEKQVWKAGARKVSIEAGNE